MEVTATNEKVEERRVAEEERKRRGEEEEKGVTKKRRMNESEEDAEEERRREEQWHYDGTTVAARERYEGVVEAEAERWRVHLRRVAYCDAVAAAALERCKDAEEGMEEEEEV